MSVRATISSGYRWRLGLIGIGFILFGFYCLYDGFVRYPAQKERFDAWERITQEQGAAAPAAWAEYARERGWSDQQPKKRSDSDIMTQFIMAAMVFPIGIIFTAAFVRSLGRWIEMDEQALRTSSGDEARFQDLVRVDDTRWKRKGISHVYYRDRNGSEQRIVLDDWKFDREPITQMHDRVEQQLGTAAENPPATPAPGSSATLTDTN